MKKHSCFVISPIGEEGSEIHQEYMDLFDLIIIPALEIFNFEVTRGDHYVSEELIDASVISKIQNADICICDISIPNPNVYYELGRRDETGKPVILLRRKNSASPMPVDIATRRYIEYDYEGRYSLREAHSRIREMVEPLIKEGFQENGRSATLSDLAETLARFERKFDKFSQRSGSTTPVMPVDMNGTTTAGDPNDQLKYAIRNRNIRMAEAAMQQLQFRLDEVSFYDTAVGPVASLGSDIAGKLLTDNAEDFVYNTSIAFKKRVDYVSNMISYIARKNKDKEMLELVSSLLNNLLSEGEANNESDSQIATVYNQKNRMYYGVYVVTKDTEYLDIALQSLEKAIELNPSDFLYYNAATCYWSYARRTQEEEHFEQAKQHIDKCMQMGTGKNINHLTLACRIYHKFNDPDFDDVFTKLQKIDPYKAANLMEELKNTPQ